MGGTRRIHRVEVECWNWRWSPRRRGKPAYDRSVAQLDRIRPPRGRLERRRPRRRGGPKLHPTSRRRHLVVLFASSERRRFINESASLAGPSVSSGSIRPVVRRVERAPLCAARSCDGMFAHSCRWCGFSFQARLRVLAGPAVFRIRAVSIKLAFCYCVWLYAEFRRSCSSEARWSCERRSAQRTSRARPPAAKE